MTQGTPTAAFLDYTPVSLTFGTSGLRGLVKDITDLEAYINVRGALAYMIGCGDLPAGGRVVLAGDLRPSSDRIMVACARAILDAGCTLENAGKIPTPALLLHAVSIGGAGVMVSGSHIPFDRNGIKINKSAGEVLKSDEAGITREVTRVRLEEYGKTAAQSAFTPSGMLKTPPELPPIDPRAEERYVRRYVAAATPGALSGLRVVVYEHSAVGRDILGRILRELGAEVIAAGRAETFVPIDTENITDDLLEVLEGLASANSGGGRLDAIVSTDGDSDRPLVVAVLPDARVAAGGRRVRFLPGDLLGIVVAEHLKADAVAVPISANDAVERRMNERKVLLRKTRIGSPYVVSAIDALRDEGTHARVMGWEANGGFLLASSVSLGGEAMGPLPSRDATLPIVANLLAARAQGGLDLVWNRLPARFGHAGLIDAVPVAVSQAILTRLAPAGNTTEVAFDDHGGVVDCSRPGAGDLDPSAREAWLESKRTLSRFFTSPSGFDAIVRINVLDGVRVSFANGDVAHVRPSGNAPQLRIYANGDSQARADRIVELGLREPDGILRQLEKAFSS